MVTARLAKALFPDAERGRQDRSILGSGDAAPAMRVVGVVDTPDDAVGRGRRQRR